MRKRLIPYLLINSLFILFFSCQQEISFDDQPSTGSLKKDMNGNCLLIKVSGTYTVAKNLGDTNYIEVDVNVTNPGSYTIKTDTINGFSFKETGRFENSGSYRVKLKGSGTPLTQGSNDFTVRYDGSVCHAMVNVVAGILPPSLASFTLQGSPNSCLNAVIKGTYVKGATLDTSSKVIVSISVTTAGSYTIATNTVNGYSFTASGNLSSTGTQTITLVASGTPVNTGTDVFTITAGTSSCTFSIPVLTPIIVTNNDHFPLTTNSHWTYDELFHVGDSLKRRITDTITLEGNQYKIMEEQPMFGAPVPYYFRKTGNDYFEYGPVDKYTNSVQYATPLRGLIPFLKENLATGDSWQSDEFSGTANFGQVILLRYLFSCTNANGTVTINGKAFSNVYKITITPQVASVGGPWGYTSEIYTYYYAKGVGMIYAKKIRNGFVFSELNLRAWLVN